MNADSRYTLRRYLEQGQVYLGSVGCLHMTQTLVDEVELRRHSATCA